MRTLLLLLVQEIERVEVAGLRPLPLPHHRTCGLPHPAVGTGSLTTAQGRSPVVTISRCFRRTLRWLPATRRPRGIHPAPAWPPDGWLPPLQRPPVAENYARRRREPQPRERFLRPFAPRGFPRFFVTQASADSSSTLIEEVSSGKVLRLSARIARLYLRRLSVTVGCRVS
jgi:hypothetical protein